MKSALLYAAVAAALASGGGAHAAATQINFGFVPLGTFSYSGTSLGTSTSLDFGTATFDTNTVGITAPFTDDAGSFLGMDVFLSETVFSYTIGSTVAANFTKTFTTGSGGAAGSQGFYTALFTSVAASSISDDFLSLTFTGTVTGPDGFSAVDVMLLNCNQSGGSGLSVNCSFTEQGPPVGNAVPEPTSLALVGGALLGIAALRRRTV
jgi:PEP-CTERM motif